MGVAESVFGRIPSRVVVPSIALHYRLHEPELGRLDEFVPLGRGAVDVGVWWGPWSWWLARRVPRVDAFEPNPQLASDLSAAMPGNVSVHQVALSDRTGEAAFWIPAGGFGTEGRGSLSPGRRARAEWTEHTVATARLDDFSLGDVGFVKIDVEGHELAVLRGASRLLDEQRPTVMVEIEQHADRKGPLDDIVDFFDDKSYRGEFLHRGVWRPIAVLDRQATREMAVRVARNGYVTNLLLYARRYVHNFVFTPR